MRFRHIAVAALSLALLFALAAVAYPVANDDDGLKTGLTGAADADNGASLSASGRVHHSAGAYDKASAALVASKVKQPSADSRDSLTAWFSGFKNSVGSSWQSAKAKISRAFTAAKGFLASIWTRLKPNASGSKPLNADDGPRSISYDDSELDMFASIVHQLSQDKGEPPVKGISDEPRVNTDSISDARDVEPAPRDDTSVVIARVLETTLANSLADVVKGGKKLFVEMVNIKKERLVNQDNMDHDDDATSLARESGSPSTSLAQAAVHGPPSDRWALSQSGSLETRASQSDGDQSRVQGNMNEDDARDPDSDAAGTDALSSVEPLPIDRLGHMAGTSPPYLGDCDALSPCTSENLNFLFSVQGLGWTGSDAATSTLTDTLSTEQDNHYDATSLAQALVDGFLAGACIMHRWPSSQSGSLETRGSQSDGTSSSIPSLGRGGSKWQIASGSRSKQISF
ncbi:hypothetical protein SeLEV6574_g08530 [Synchytrium endobioticum]|uniref:Uncharacterized protein n=1 Tax=Synchytrium endobioticum TaxID=286115 RepID=A0A507BVI9_9FUNG|nr:hypothetical protein SeLEV6574_g08530 [Synchytrium endobioticum]